MPWSMSNPPPPAKNWPAAKKRRCIAAGNAALAAGKSEEEAIYACIGAAKRVKQKARNRVSPAQVTLYEREQNLAKTAFEKLASDYLTKSTDLQGFNSQMKDYLKKFYIRIALIAKGKHPFTDRDRHDLQKFLGLTYGYLDGFTKDLEAYKRLASDQGVISRASSYGVGWGVFSRYSIPGELADMLPDLPGISCMGNGDCGCILEYDNDVNGYNVYWIVSPFKEHCVICMDLGIEWSPYQIPYEEFEAEYGPSVFDDDYEFVEF